jgi:NADH dehydrogenase FAD-containing subunit
LSASGERSTVVFAGGGHAQLYSLQRTRELTKKGFDVVLVNPGRFLYYSGMAPGTLNRTYRPEEVRIDVRYLVGKGGGHFIEDRVKGIRERDNMVLLESGGSIRYDAMSVAVGSTVPENGLQTADRAVPVKPVENMIGLRDKLLKSEGNSPDYKPEVLVVGGGAAGCEVACNAKRAFEEHGIDGCITIAD